MAPNNDDFLKSIRESFKEYLKINTSRSPKKLEPLHGHIAKDIESLLDNKDFTIQSKGYGKNKEGKILGRYYQKNIDITINYKGEAIAGYAIKFIMRNYSQNSHNYFENMLGETANLRAKSIPYFQIFIIFDKVPHYKSGGQFSKYDEISVNNLNQYINLSNDNPECFFHTPNKTLIILIKLKEKEPNYIFQSEKDYASFYLSIIDDKDLMNYSDKFKNDFGKTVILNDYKTYLEKTVFFIKSITN